MSETPGWQSTCTSVIAGFDAEIDNLLKNAVLGTPSTFTVVSKPTPVLGSLLRFRVQGISTEILETVLELSKKRGSITCSWMTDDAVYLRTGAEFWAMTRTDRGKGSRVKTIDNNEPISSHRHIQVVELRIGDPLVPSPFTRSYQEMAWFLHSSLRLNPVDISRIIEEVEAGVSDWKWPLDGTRLPTLPSSDPLLAASLACLRHPLEYPYGDALQLALQDTSALRSLANDHDISAAERSISNTWLVLCTTGPSWYASKPNLNLMKPSFFLASNVPNMLPQVHVIDNAVAKHRETLMMVFTQKPEPKTMDAAIDHIFSTIGSGRRSTWTHTEPYFYTRIPATYKVFRPDGECNINFIDKVLTPRLCAALSVTKTDETTTFEHWPVPSNGSLPTTVVLYVRQSTWKQEESLARQLWSMITNPFEGVFPLADNTKLIVAIEICSSSVHPLYARLLPSRLLGGMKGPFTLLTANPDRLTRRSDEVQVIVDRLQQVQGRWMTSSCKGDDLDKDEWYDVKDIRSAVEEQVQLGRELSFSIGWHMRCITAETRVLVQPDTKSIRALREIIRAAFEYHEIQEMVFFCRVSPLGKAQNEGKEIPSLERQHEFMKRLLPLGFPTTVIRSIGVSASSGDSLASIKSAMDSQTRNTCLVAVSLDRVFRKQSFFQDLRAHFAGYQNYNHLALSLLWDSQSGVSCRKSLLLPSTFTGLNAVMEWDEFSTKAFRAIPSSVNIPTVQPIIWCGKPDLDTAIEAIIDRHADAAEDFGKAFGLGNYNGRKELPLELKEISVEEKCMGPMRQARWTSFLTKILHISPSNLDVYSYIDECTCTCEAKAKSPQSAVAGEPHSVFCQCMCAYCREERSCPCLVGQCVCDVICNCRCYHCHNGAVCEDYSNPGSAASPVQRQDQCANPGCTKRSITRMAWCSVGCYKAATPVQEQRYCSVEGCRNVAPPGNGDKCLDHKNASYRMTRKSRSKAAQEAALAAPNASGSRKRKR